MVVLRFTTCNNLGALARILKVLKEVPSWCPEDGGVNIVYTKVAVHTNDKLGDIEITVNDYDRERAKLALRRLAKSRPELKLRPTGMSYRIIFSISNEPGALLEVSESLAKEKIDTALCCGPEPGSTEDQAIMRFELNSKKCSEEKYNKAKELIASFAKIVNESPFVSPPI